MNAEKVLITGASSGIGKSLAAEFAKHGHPLVLTARLQSELEVVARELEDQFHVSVQVIPQDLEEPNATQNIYEQASAESGTVDILVNDAGLGRRGKFWDIPLEEDLAMIRVNVESVV